MVLGIPPTCPNRCTLAWLATLGCSTFLLLVSVSERCVFRWWDRCAFLPPAHMCTGIDSSTPPPLPFPHPQTLINSSWGREFWLILGPTPSSLTSDRKHVYICLLQLQRLDVLSLSASLGSSWKLRKGRSRLARRLWMDGCPRTRWRVSFVCCACGAAFRGTFGGFVHSSLISPIPLSPTP